MLVNMRIKFILIVTLGIILLSGCTTLRINNDCEEKAKEVLGTSFSMLDAAGMGFIDLHPNGGGQINRLIYKKGGDDPGENVNYFYPAHSDFDADLLEFIDYYKYQKKVVAGDGTIIGIRRFDVRIIFKPVTELIQASQYATGTIPVEIASTEFLSCQWIDDPQETQPKTEPEVTVEPMNYDNCPLINDCTAIITVEIGSKCSRQQINEMIERCNKQVT
ncbi:MAG: hypothetical protein Q7S92_05890 [Candidatus Diapherotrites archaeon]|nr:hypothetical protein [Candidatus Diapherotrites archaeon]